MLIKTKNTNNGFTLVELLITMAILIILTAMMVGIINAIGITNKGRDAQRKKDLNRIKIAFEEYFNNKGYFPQEDLLTQLRDKNNCGRHIEDFPDLNVWPCDPNGNPYFVLTEIKPNRFRIITNLEYKKDKDIPIGWYIKNDFNFPTLGLTTSNANYGVSSSNILWYEDFTIDYSNCYTNTCYDGNAVCKHSAVGCVGKCYYQSKVGSGCVPECRVNCCGDGCND